MTDPAKLLPERRPSSTTRWRWPRVVPSSWVMVGSAIDGAMWEADFSLRVMASVATERDGLEWVHVSVSHRKRVPTWEEFRDAVQVVVGPLRESYVVLPPADRYVNDHPYCLHAFCCLDGPRLPDFRVENARGIGL